ncbi:MAG TPA: decaprenyl-phosphate phosphoribosyltransferase [Candidatus Heimdallarchaeota archaeon]|nr:decaprenyl-phosphate phosphoribosyltransferase [Candidatus Heimdallarchaeota archaeon]
MALVELFKSIRPQQWLKNLFIFAPLIFSENIFNRSMFLQSLLAFAVFCLLSGALYILNDLKDLEEDRIHPIKSKRPLAAGKLKKSQAITAFIILSFISLLFASLVNEEFLWVCLVYYVLQIAYSFALKHVVILDVFIVASGFFLRVIAGAVAIQVQISPWLLICTTLLALFLALSKRRHEILLLDEEAINHRPILKEYSAYLLDQMISVVTASTVIAYCLYTISGETIEKFGTNKLILTVPFVLYGIFRYLYLIHQKAEGGTPETLILKDHPLLLDIILWIVSAALIIYFGW